MNESLGIWATLDENTKKMLESLPPQMRLKKLKEIENEQRKKERKSREVY